MRRYAFLLCLLLAGCFEDIAVHLTQCQNEALVRYPDENKRPVGQPYKDIMGCMYAAGYEFDPEVRQCSSLDYTARITRPACYQPSGAMQNFAYKLNRIFR